MRENRQGFPARRAGKRPQINNPPADGGRKEVRNNEPPPEFGRGFVVSR